MTRAAFRVTLFAVSVALLDGCGKAEFKPFNSAAGKFSCEFPGSPKEQSQSVSGTQMKMFSVEERTGAYMVAYADMPIPANETPAEIQARLDGSRDGMVQNMKGTFKSESKIELNGKHPGREVQADLPKENAGVRARVYLVGTRLYQIMVVGKKGFTDSAEATRFLNSLKLME